MTVFSSTALGFWIQWTMLSGVFCRTPATYMRAAIPVSGGPTRPCALEMPAIVWQEGQPYLEIAALPRFTSPPVTDDAICACPLLQEEEMTHARRATHPSIAALRRSLCRIQAANSAKPAAI